MSSALALLADGPAPALLPKLIHPDDQGRVRRLWVVAEEGLTQALRCEACHRIIRSKEVRPATDAEIARWRRAPAVPFWPSTGQYL